MPWLLLLLAVSPHARRRWWLWGAASSRRPSCGEALQELVGRLRPQGTALGFPSGHATAIAAFAVATVYLVGRSRLPPAVRVAISLAVVLLMLAIGFSRMVLDAHWTLDVVAGFALGAAGAAAAAWWDASHPAPRGRAGAARPERLVRRGRATCPRSAGLPGSAGVDRTAFGRWPHRAGGNSASLRARGHPKLPVTPFRVTSAETFTTLRSSAAGACPAGLHAKVTSKGAPLMVPKTR